MTGNLHVENNFVAVQLTRPSLTSAIVIKEGGAMHWLRCPLWTRVRVTALALDLNSCVSSCKSLNHSVNVCVKLKWKYVKFNCINSKMYIPHLMCIILFRLSEPLIMSIAPFYINPDAYFHQHCPLCENLSSKPLYHKSIL